MDSRKFKYVSLAGRVAFGINCLEETLIFLNIDLDKWKPVLEDLWKFTSVEFLDDWNGLMAEMLPGCILEFKGFNSDYEYIDEDKFYYLHALYQNIDKRLVTIMNCILQIGESHAYSVIVNYGIESLNNLQILIDFMLENRLPMPSIDKYRAFSINENNGWGNKFDGKTLSIVL